MANCKRCLRYGNSNFSSILSFIGLMTKANRSVVYYPETAYWCNYDIVVPLFLAPLYALSRIHDLQLIDAVTREASSGASGEKAQKAQEAQQAPPRRLDGQVLFESGWQWGYWLQNAVAQDSQWQHPSNDDTFFRSDGSSSDGSSSDGAFRASEKKGGSGGGGGGGVSGGGDSRVPGIISTAVPPAPPSLPPLDMYEALRGSMRRVLRSLGNGGERGRRRQVYGGGGAIPAPHAPPALSALPTDVLADALVTLARHQHDLLVEGMEGGQPAGGWNGSTPHSYDKVTTTLSNHPTIQPQHTTTTHA